MGNGSDRTRTRTRTPAQALAFAEHVLELLGEAEAVTQDEEDEEAVAFGLERAALALGEAELLEGNQERERLAAARARWGALARPAG